MTPFTPPYSRFGRLLDMGNPRREVDPSSLRYSSKAWSTPVLWSQTMPGAPRRWRQCEPNWVRTGEELLEHCLCVVSEQGRSKLARSELAAFLGGFHSSIHGHTHTHPHTHRHTPTDTLSHAINRAYVIVRPRWNRARRPNPECHIVCGSVKSAKRPSETEVFRSRSGRSHSPSLRWRTQSKRHS